MRKLFIAALITVATFGTSTAQGTNSPQSRDEIIRLAQAPAEPDGIGRAVVLVSDESGNPVSGAYTKLASTWGGNQFCESWGSTNNQGAIALIPIHMGSQLRLRVKAKGYQTQEVNINASSLNEPVRVTLARKK